MAAETVVGTVREKERSRLERFKRYHKMRVWSRLNPTMGVAGGQSFSEAKLVRRFRPVLHGEVLIPRVAHKSRLRQPRTALANSPAAHNCCMPIPTQLRSTVDQDLMIVVLVVQTKSQSNYEDPISSFYLAFGHYVKLF